METNSTLPGLRQNLEAASLLTALIVTGTLGIASFLALPSIILGLVSDLGFSEQQLGRISTLQLLGLGLGSVASVKLLRRLDWRNLARSGLALMLISDFACIFAGEFVLLSVLRFISGFAGGVCVSFVAYGLGQTVDKDRNFAYFLTAQVCFAIIAIFTFSSVLDLIGLSGIFIFFCVLEALAIILVSRFIPPIRWGKTAPGQGNDTYHWSMCALVLLGMVFYFTALGGIWTYIAPIGIAAGLSEQQTGSAVSIGLFGGLLGAYSVALLHAKFGRALPMITSLGLQLAALLILYQGFSYYFFIIAAALFCFGWYMYIPYQFALLATFDRDGRPMLLLNAVAGFGSGLGPAIVAFILVDGFSRAYVICALFLALALACHLSAIVIRKARLPGVPAA